LQHISTLKGHKLAKYLLKHIQGYKIAFTKLRSQMLQFCFVAHVALLVIN